jgi:hypothetical protein
LLLRDVRPAGPHRAAALCRGAYPHGYPDLDGHAHRDPDQHADSDRDSHADEHADRDEHPNGDPGLLHTGNLLSRHLRLGHPGRLRRHDPLQLPLWRELQQRAMRGPRLLWRRGLHGRATVLACRVLATAGRRRTVPILP